METERPVYERGVAFCHGWTTPEGKPPSSRISRRSTPVRLMHGDNDRIVPIADSALLSVKLLKNEIL